GQGPGSAPGFPGHGWERRSSSLAVSSPRRNPARARAGGSARPEYDARADAGAAGPAVRAARNAEGRQGFPASISLGGDRLELPPADSGAAAPLHQIVDL